MIYFCRYPGHLDEGLSGDKKQHKAYRDLNVERRLRRSEHLWLQVTGRRTPHTRAEEASVVSSEKDRSKNLCKEQSSYNFNS